MSMGLGVTFVAMVNWLILGLITVVFVIVIAVLLVRFLWRQGGKKIVPMESANNAEKAVGLGEVLRSRRQGCGMTQELVAEQLGVSRQAVSRWEKGEARPSTANIQALAGLYGIAPAELLQEAKK